MSNVVKFPSKGSSSSSKKVDEKTKPKKEKNPHCEDLHKVEHFFLLQFIGGIKAKPPQFIVVRDPYLLLGQNDDDEDFFPPPAYA
jgi:hypothetical protein